MTDGISTHAPRTGSDTRQRVTPPNAKGISTHAPRTGSDGNAGEHVPRIDAISTHAPRTGSDNTGIVIGLEFAHFNPRSPHGERRTRPSCASDSLHFNPRSPHGERLAGASAVRGVPAISTHAPRTGSDRRRWRMQSDLLIFQPTLPARGATPQGFPRHQFVGEFQPTLPARGATSRCLRRLPDKSFQPTLPARGATDTLLADADVEEISTHAPRTGSDSLMIFSCHGSRAFQPTLPARGATFHSVLRFLASSDFNPRSPHGERLYHPVKISCIMQFQPTLPARGATAPSC